MNQKLHAHWRRDRATGFHCGKCGQIFVPVVSLGDRRSPYQEIMKAYETHDCADKPVEEIDQLSGR